MKTVTMIRRCSFWWLARGALLSNSRTGRDLDVRIYSSCSNGEEPTNRADSKLAGKKSRSDKQPRISTGAIRKKETYLLDSDDTQFNLHFPFRGTLSKCDVSDLSNICRDVPETETTFSIHKCNACDTSDERKYVVCKGDEVFSLPSVTTVLNLTLPKKRNFMLYNWKRGMVREFGEDGYRQVKDEIKAAGCKFHVELESKLYRPDLLSIKPHQHFPAPEFHPVSTSFPSPVTFPPNHRLTDIDNVGRAQEVMNTNTPSASGGDRCNNNTKEKDNPFNGSYLESVNQVLADITDVYSLESIVAHLELGYCGTCDCIATYRGDLCLIDWKTSSKPRPSIADLHDYPLQAVAYAGAVNQDPHYPFKVENVLIVTAYPSGEPCHVHLFPYELCERYWEQWLLRLMHYQTLFSSDLTDVHI